MVKNEKSAEVLRAEEMLAQAKARLAEAKKKESAKKRKEVNQHKYTMGGIVHKYFPAGDAPTHLHTLRSMKL